MPIRAEAADPAQMHRRRQKKVSRDILVKKMPVFDTQGTGHGQLIGILKFYPDPERISGPGGDRQHPVRF